jgi:hypothetical protein
MRIKGILGWELKYKIISESYSDIPNSKAFFKAF